MLPLIQFARQLFTIKTNTFRVISVLSIYLFQPFARIKYTQLTKNEKLSLINKTDASSECLMWTRQKNAHVRSPAKWLKNKGNDHCIFNAKPKQKYYTSFLSAAIQSAKQKEKKNLRTMQKKCSCKHSKHCNEKPNDSSRYNSKLQETSNPVHHTMPL